MSDENEVHASELETWTLCVPKPGPPTREAVQGVPMMAWQLTETQSDQLEASIRLLSHDVRRGRPLLYRGDRRLLPERTDVEEERELIARASARDPVEGEAAAEAVSFKMLRQQLVLEIEMKRRELQNWDEKIEQARRRFYAEEERVNKRVADAHSHGQKLVREAQEHYEGCLRNVWETESNMEQHTTRSVQRLGEQINLATEAKRQVDSIMRAKTTGEWFGQAREALDSVLNSPMGQAGQTAIGARIAAMVSRKMGQPCETDDALMAIMMQGKAFRMRLELVHEMKAATPAGNWRAEAILLGANFLVGTVEPKVLAKFIGEGNE